MSWWGKLDCLAVSRAYYVVCGQFPGRKEGVELNEIPELYRLVPKVILQLSHCIGLLTGLDFGELDFAERPYVGECSYLLVMYC